MDQIAYDLRFWIAENIIAGVNPADLAKILRDLKVPQTEIDKELSQIQSHPYIEAGKKYHSKLKRRESLLKTLDYQKKHNDGYIHGIKKVPLPSFKDFLRDYYYENRIGLFSGAVDHWEAKNWTPRNLVEKVGAETEVEIQFDREKDPNYESNSHKHKKLMKFGEFVDLVENTGSSNNFYMTANNQALENSTLSKLEKDIANIGDGYMSDDRKGRMFLWVGPKGIITPLHHDLTNNMFIQIYGRKKFTLIPSMQVPYMYNNMHVYSDVDLLNHDPAVHPEYSNVNKIEIIVEPGDFLFIPLGWWHHVVGLTTNISLSFTNFNVWNGAVDFPVGGRY